MVKPSTRVPSGRTPLPQPPPPPPPRGPARSGAIRSASERDAESARARPNSSKRGPILIIAGVAVLLIGCLAVAAAWGPMQRSSQLAALDACRSPERIEEALRLAQAFSARWGERSEHVAEAIASGRGPVEARIQMCRDGRFIALLARLLPDEQLTPAQRGMVCAALSELWPDDDGPELPPRLADWALAADAPPPLSTPALRLLVAASPPEAEAGLARAAADGSLPPERAVAIAVALGEVLERRNLGVRPLLTALGGAHRGALLASPAVAECVRRNAQPGDAAALLDLLGQPDGVALAIAGLGGRNFTVGDGDAQARSSLTAQLAPFLVPGQEDVVLAGALQVVHRQRLLGLRTQVIALLPRLAQRRPEQLPKDDLVDLLGRSLISSRTPEAAAAAEEMVTALSGALDQAGTRNLAIVALSRVQDPHVAALRPALDALAGCGEDGTAAVDILVTKVYGREDVARAGRSRGWGTILAEDRRKRARHDGMVRWLAQHGEENNARVDPAVLAANQKELGRMRDELRGWLESKDPPPLGLDRGRVEALVNKVQTLLWMVNKAIHPE